MIDKNTVITAITVSTGIATVISSLMALVGLYLSSRSERLSKRPYFTLSGITFNKSNYHLFSNSKEFKHNKIQKLDESTLKIIKDSRGKMSMQSIKGDKYLLINLIDKNIEDMQNVYLSLAPAEFTYDNTGERVNEITFKKGYSILKGYKNKYWLTVGKAKFYPNKDNCDRFTFKIAYACIGDDKKVSFFYQKLFEVEGEQINFLNDSYAVKEYVNFDKEYFKLKCKNYQGKKYTIKVRLVNEDDLISPYIIVK